MTYTRTANLAVPVSLDDAKDHLRVIGNHDDLAIQRLILAAAREIEAYCDIALTRQTITVMVKPGEDVILLVGPLAPDAVVTLNGTPFAITQTAGVPWITDLPEGAAVLTYEAGFGDTAASVPDDLQLAVLEQVAWHYDNRGVMDVRPGLTPAAARICARYRRVRA